MIIGRKLEIKWKFSAGYFQHLKHFTNNFQNTFKAKVRSFRMSVTNIRNTHVIWLLKTAVLKRDNFCKPILCKDCQHLIQYIEQCCALTKLRVPLFFCIMVQKVEVGIYKCKSQIKERILIKYFLQYLIVTTFKRACNISAVLLVLARHIIVIL